MSRSKNNTNLKILHHIKMKKSEYSDTIVGATIGNDFTNGKHGYAKSRRGAKKFINSRIRFAENQQLRREVKESL